MKQLTANFSGCDMIFEIYDGTVQGYNKFVETTTSVTGGKGKIKTSDWTGKVSGKIAPVSTTTTHTHHTEFFIQEEDGREITIRLINTPQPFHDGQQITAYKVHDTGQLYKIVNRNTGAVTVVTPLNAIVYQSHFFKKIITNNAGIKVLWYAVLAVIIGWVGWSAWDIFSHRYDWLTILIGALFMIPAYLLYKITRQIIAGYVAKGLAKKAANWG
ncbi:MAG: hypothetical protein ACTHMV_00590 [Chitinophagaceae bacterium]